MPVRITGGVFTDQVLTGSLAHYVVIGADFSGAINQYGRPVPNSAAEIIFTNISESAYINIMNPNSLNLSFALEAGRSTWTEYSLTAMVQGLGTDVGSDHLNLSQCIVKQVPYIWDTTFGGESFLDLTDTPSTYAGAAGYVVTVNGTADGLIFTPSGGGGGSDAYTPVTAPTTLAINQKYIVTNAGTVNLPILTGLVPSGSAIRIAKSIGNVVMVVVGDISNQISTDLGNTDTIEFDSTEEILLVSVGTTWQLQIGSKV